ncbi:MAG: hypothetical protein LR015_07800 [Verrucomicrobia bacterium]|nr:hypothetical protein [Verrucomicrobiota bacterium]
MTPKGDFQKYGRFDEQRLCFALTEEPPRKWWNLHCNAIDHQGTEMYAEVAHINDGPTRVRDAAGVSVLLVGYDQKYLYIRNEQTGTVFSPSGHPAPTPVQGRKIEFHLEKSLMSSNCEGLNATQGFCAAPASFGVHHCYFRDHHG